MRVTECVLKINNDIRESLILSLRVEGVFYLHERTRIAKTY